MDERIQQLHLIAGRAAGIEKTCGKKNKFVTLEAASKAAESHNRWKDRRHDVEPYPCAFCLQWHIGNIMPVTLLEQIAAEHSQKC